MNHRMNHRITARITLALSLWGTGVQAQQRRPAPTSRPVADQLDSLADVSPRAMQIYRKAIVVDTHNDMPTKVADEGYNPDIRNPIGFGPGKGSTDFPRLLQSGITGQFMSAFVDAPYAIMTPDSSFARAMLLTNQVHAFVKRHPDRLVFATSGAQLRRAKRGVARTAQRHEAGFTGVSAYVDVAGALRGNGGLARRPAAGRRVR